MAIRLPGNIRTTEEFWDFLVTKRDARAPIPSGRRDTTFAVDRGKQDGPHWTTYEYMLDDSDISAFDASLFSMTRSELERTDPQQRLLLELARECSENAGEVNWRNKNIGVYIGSFGEDWNGMQSQDTQDVHLYTVLGSADCFLSNRVSYEYNLSGPSLTVRTACSTSLYALHLACQAVQNVRVPSAVVGGVNLNLSPSKTQSMYASGALSVNASCKSFDFDASGYARAEAVNMVFVKRLDEAPRDGNSVRGRHPRDYSQQRWKEAGITRPSVAAQEALIRSCYSQAGLDHEVRNTGFFEPDMGHSEGASGLMSLIKCVLALEKKSIPPNIKFNKPNPKIPFDQGKLRVPTEVLPWPKDRFERVSINSFGVGGSNAHTIIDSAASYGLLLAFTANHPKSLQTLIQEHRDYISEHPAKLNNVAYTLGMRREHLPHRAFALASSSGADNATMTVSAPYKAPSTVPEVVFVFTGQRAQWATMGAKLIRNYSSAMDDLAAMDDSLTSLGPSLSPDWTLADELTRLDDTSRVHKAELSQPLCTAVQIVLVNLLRQWGIFPVAVIGHSSGEIPAAYASGTLTMHEAIICAYLRGKVTALRNTTKVGGMAAIGLGKEATQKFCDKERVIQVIENVKAEHPDILARMLKVDMAYHSHHMAELGELYQELLSPHISRSEVPFIPLWSTVTGTSIMDQPTILDAQYWRANLESPVRFNTSLKSLIARQHCTPTVLVEIGPHPSLSSPIRQIIHDLCATEYVSYLATLSRGSDDAKALLTTVGHLFCQGHQIRFDALNPRGGRVLSDLPTEECKALHHELLGSRIVEASGLEPSWRNLFRLDTVPWCRDHKVGKEIVFPAAGYLAMASEAMRQVSGGTVDAIALRQVHLVNALVLTSEVTEMVLSMRPHQVTSALDSAWYEFTVSSFGGEGQKARAGADWIKHWFGQVRAAEVTQTDKITLAAGLGESLPRNVSSERWYKTMSNVGLNYGPNFQRLDDITAHPAQNIAVARLHLNRQPRTLQSKGIPTYIRQAYFKNISRLRHGVEGMNGIEVTPLDTGLDEQSNSDSHGGSRLLWQQDIDFCSANDIGILIHYEETVSREAGMRSLQKLVMLCCLETAHILQKRPKSATEVPGQLFKFQSWILDHAQKTMSEASYAHISKDEFQGIVDLSSDDRHRTISELSRTLAASSYAAIDALELLRRDNGLTKLYDWVNKWNYTGFLRLFTHRSPRLRVLEIGAGTGGTTDSILAGLTSYDSYTFSDISAAFFPAAKERFKHVKCMDFKTLDISSDPLQQGFEARSFDLIVAAHVLHATPSLHNTLVSVRKLLRPDGRLLLQELCPTIKWSNFIMGGLPGWWLGEADSRSQEPYVSTERWADELVAAGFSFSKISVVHDSDTPSSRVTYTIIAAPNTDSNSIRPHGAAGAAGARSVQIISGDASGHVAASISKTFQQQGISVNFIKLADKYDSTQPIISIVDLEGPALLENMTSSRFQELRGFFSRLGLSGTPEDNVDNGEKARPVMEKPACLLWLTRPCQLRCKSTPQYATILGFLRVLRNELGTPLASLEMDEWESAKAQVAVWQVYRKLSRTTTAKPDDRADPDYEFAYSTGSVYIPRVCAVSVGNELASKFATPKVEGMGKTRLRVEVGRKGILNSLRWVQRPLLRAEELGPWDISIEVKAVGMNFKDSMIAMGIVKNHSDGFGIDCAGIVRAVGPEAHATGEFKVGDRVMAIADDGYATVTTTLAAHCIRIPDSMALEEAATMPTVYGTVMYSLLDLARLEKGQTILIHSASGGVGIAALNLCRAVGLQLKSEVFVTVCNEEKTEFLVAKFGIPRDHIFCSRDASFRDGIMRETGNKGVDIVLTSLSGELLHASWRCVAEFGSMIELGKRDFLDQGRLEMDQFEDNRSFFGVDVGALRGKRPAKVKEILTRCVKLYENGKIQPIRPIRLLDAADMPNAIRTIQKGQHIGKLVVAMPEGPSVLNATSVRGEFSLRPDVSYLLSGGLGGLGRSISVWMAENGAKNLVFITRGNGTRSQDRALFEELACLGCTAQIITGSVSDIEDVRKAVRMARLPIAGVIHLAMVLRDSLFTEMLFDDWEAVIKPKGQANYAAANTFLDAFVQFRRARKLPASVIDLGVVADVGYVSERKDLLDKLKDRHSFTIQEQHVLDGIELSIKYGHMESERQAWDADKSIMNPNGPASGHGLTCPQQLLLGIRSSAPLSDKDNRMFWKRDARVASQGSKSNLAAGINSHSSNEKSSPEGDNDNAVGNLVGNFLAEIETNPQLLTTGEGVTRLAKHIRSALCGFVMKPEADLDLTAGFTSLGIDSLVAIEMRNWSRQRLGLDISVLEIMRAGNITSLAEIGARRLMMRCSA
ncbi:putative polyketide synthase [Naviculisporaceae sp. PSN 640]